MMRSCPKCGSFNVRRSSFHGTPTLTMFGILSPYRCRECRTLFRGVSREVQMGIAVTLTVAVSASLFLLWLRQMST